MIFLVFRGRHHETGRGGVERDQPTPIPEGLVDWIDENNPVCLIDVLVDNLNLAGQECSSVDRPSTGLPAYHPAMLREHYGYGYLDAAEFEATFRAGKDAKLIDRD